MIEIVNKIIFYSNKNVEKFKIIVYTNHAFILFIVKQFILITFSTNKLNLRLIRTSKFFSRFNFDVRYKFDKNHLISNALFKLSNDNKKSHSKSKNEFDVLHVYHTILIELKSKFRFKIIKKYIKNKT